MQEGLTVNHLVEVYRAETNARMGLYRVQKGPGDTLYLDPVQGRQKATQKLLWGDAR